MEIKTKVFANQLTEEDKAKKKPDYSVRDKNSGHDIAIWKNEDGSLYMQIKPTEQR